MTPRGVGFQTEQGFKTRTPFESTIDVHVDYDFRLFGARQLTLLADVFNLTGRQGVRDYDDFTETTFGAENPDFGRILVYQDTTDVPFRRARPVLNSAALRGPGPGRTPSPRASGSDSNPSVPILLNVPGRIEPCVLE